LTTVMIAPPPPASDSVNLPAAGFAKPSQNPAYTQAPGATVSDGAQALGAVF